MAVYTRVDETQLAELLARYDIGEATEFTGITQGVENSNYRLVTTKGEFILTLYEKRVDRADLPFFIGLMGHLAKRGISCPRPVADRNDEIIQEICGRAAAIVTFLEGTWSKAPTTKQCKAVGKVLAQMHIAGRNYKCKRKNALNVHSLDQLLNSSISDFDEKLGTDLTVLSVKRDIEKSEMLVAVEDGLWNIATVRLMNILEKWPKRLPRGVLHADLFPDNVLFTGDNVTGVIDFYFACNDFLAYDLAIVLNAWCYESNSSYNFTKARQLVAGYQSARPLSKREVAAMPVLFEGAAMRFFLTRLYDWVNTPENAQVKPHNPMDYWKRLNFHRHIDTPSAYGFDT